MSQTIEPGDRYIFVLRMWREHGGSWRVVLQHAHTKVNYGFRTLAEAFAFVEALCPEECEQ